MGDFLHAACFKPEWADFEAFRLLGLGLSVRYRELATAVDSMAGLLANSGLGRGDRIALAAPPSFDFAVALLAGVRIGAAVAPLDISLRGLSLNSALKALAPDAIVGRHQVLARFPAESARLVIACDTVDDGGTAAIVGNVGSAAANRPFHIVAAPGGGSGVAAIAPGCESSDDALLVATSGSTGVPKYVRLGHAGILFNIREHLRSFELTAPFRALQALGSNYSYGLVSSFLAPLTAGGTIVLPRHSDAAALRSAIAQERPAVCLMTPALIEYLLDTCPDEELAALGNLEKLGIGGDTCREQQRCKIALKLPNLKPYITYGTTEAGPRIATLPPDQFLARPSSVGVPLAGVEVEVTDTHGVPVAAGVPGRLKVRTPSRMSGYLGATGQVASGDWLDTGDIAAMDAEGYLTVFGRAGRSFKHRGRLLDPTLVESVLAQFPGVIAARVQASESELCATVHCRPESTGGDFVEFLRRHCRRNLPSRLVPHKIVAVAESDAYFFKGRRLSFEAHARQHMEAI